MTKGLKHNHGDGTEKSVGLGLATKPKDNLPGMRDVRIDNPGAKTPVKRLSELRLGTAGMAQGLANGSKIKVDADEVILRKVSSMKNACGSPKTPIFKPKKNIFKIALPY